MISYFADNEFLMFLAESLFQLKFCAKQLDRLSKKAEKEQRANEKKVIFWESLIKNFRLSGLLYSLYR